MRYTQRESIGCEIEHLDALAHTWRQHGLSARETLLIDRRDKGDGQRVGHLGNQFFNAHQGGILGSRFIDGQFLAPPFQVREIHFHLADILLPGDGLRHTLFDLIDKLSAMLNHLVHRAVLQELAVLVAIDAIVLILTAVGIGAEQILGERHSAALTKFLFHIL